MSEPTYMDVSVLFKLKLVDRLMSEFQLQLKALMDDPQYKQLKPDKQMFAISELTHWWSIWFQKIPAPADEASLDFLKVDPSEIDPQNLEAINPKEMNWYAYLLSLSVSNQQRVGYLR
jgi:hypothetical protein